MINEIYNQRILELAGNIPRLGRLANPDASAKAHSRLCGSTVVIDLCVKDGRVVDFAHDVKACALGQASSSLMARHVIGATAKELNELRDRVTRMLKANGPPPEGKWAEFAVLEPVRDYKARHASTLLTFDAVADALGSGRRARGGPGGRAGAVSALTVAPRRAAHALIRFYQLTLSSLIGRQCRYLPTCSAYADEAIERHGLWAGSWMGLARVCRCHPWGGSGYDPPPDRLPPNASWAQPWRYGCWRSSD